MITINDYQKDLNSELDKYILQKFSKLKYSPQFLNEIREEIVKRVQASPTYTSLLYGDLRLEFGLANPGADLTGVLNDLVNPQNVKVEIGTPGSVFIRVDINIGFFISDSGVYLSDGGIVDWLNWLLNAGENSVVTTHKIIYAHEVGKDFFPTSRTGHAIMVEGGTYSVPGKWAGTENSNWLTKALDGIQDYIFNVIKREVQ